MTEQDVHRLMDETMVVGQQQQLEALGFPRGIMNGINPNTGILLQIIASGDKQGTLSDVITGKVIPSELYRFETDDYEKAKAWRVGITKFLLDGTTNL